MPRERGVVPDRQIRLQIEWRAIGLAPMLVVGGLTSHPVAASSFANAGAGHESAVLDMTFATVVGGTTGAHVKSTALCTP